MAHRNPLLIAVEGLDGCGKSTLARMLADALGATFLRTPHDLDSATRDAMEAHCARSALARMLFYSATVAAAACGIRAELAAGHDVVVDRYWLSTVVYHCIMGSPCLLDEVADTLPAADATFFLHAPLEVRARRVQTRGHATDADRWSLRSGFSRRIENLYREFSRHRIVGHFLELDASERTPDTLVAAAITLLRTA